jgi:hypothetical protein
MGQALQVVVELLGGGDVPTFPWAGSREPRTPGTSREGR